MKQFVMIGAINGFLAVALGAFGAHSLRDRISVDHMEVYKTGVQYHMGHALALILVALLLERWPSARPLRAVGWLFTIGIVFFSGSLYALAVSGQRILGAITPIGGLCFLIGWALLAVTAASRDRSE